MPYTIAAPEILRAAAADLATIESSLSAARAAAAPTAALVPAAADEVSASIAHLFSQHAEDYWAVAAQADAFHQQFMQNLKASARSYASTEAASTWSLRSLGASTGSHTSSNAGAQNQSPNVVSSLLPVNVTPGDVLALPFLLLLLSLLLPVELPLVLLLLVLDGDLVIF